MSAILTPYLTFAGNAREAMSYYESVFGGKLDVMTFADMGGMGLPEEQHDKVMHSALTVADGVCFMGSDNPGGPQPSDQSVALSGDDEATLTGWFDALAAGASTVDMPLEKAPWGDSFGQVTDQFGVRWMVNITGSGAPSQEAAV